MAWTSNESSDGEKGGNQEIGLSKIHVMPL